MSAADPAAPLRRAIAEWRTRTAPPLVVAIDGHGAAGKSTIAELTAADPELEATVVHVDDCWRAASAAAGGPPRAGQPLADYYDWARLRAVVLEPLLTGRAVRFTAVDPDTEEPFERTLEPRPVILLEGVSAACEEFADLVDRTVLVDTPEPERLRRLHARVPAEAWNQRWLDAERMYLATRPPDSFDLIVSGAEAG